MKSIEIAKALYRDHIKTGIGFEEMLTKYLSEDGGAVVCSPTYLGRYWPSGGTIGGLYGKGPVPF